MSTCSTCPALAPLIAIGPVQMWGPNWRGTFWWMAGSAGGTLSGSRYQALRIPHGQQRLAMLILMQQSGSNIEAFLDGAPVNVENPG